MLAAARFVAIFWAAGLGLAVPVSAQEVLGFSLGQPATQSASVQIRTIDDERLFRQSLFGQRVAEEIGRASRALEAENDRLLEELTAQEADLTNRRSEMSVEEFRSAATEFDVFAEEARRSQAEKRQRLTQFEEAERRRFFASSEAVLQRVLEQVGGDILIDGRAVIIARPGLDMTDAAIAGMDEEIGDGGAPAFPLNVP